MARLVFIYSCILFAHLAVQHTITLNVMKSQRFFVCVACSHKVKEASCLGILDDFFYLSACWFCVLGKDVLSTIVPEIVVLLL